MIPNSGKEGNSRLGWFSNQGGCNEGNDQTLQRLQSQTAPKGQNSGTRAALGKLALGRKHPWDYNGDPAILYIFSMLNLNINMIFNPCSIVSLKIVKSPSFVTILHHSTTNAAKKKMISTQG